MAEKGLASACRRVFAAGLRDGEDPLRGMVAASSLGARAGYEALLETTWDF